MTKKRRITTEVLVALGSILLVLAIMMIVVFLVRGQTIVTGDYPADNISKSLSCVGHDVDYPFFDKKNITKTQTNIDVIFIDQLASKISLAQYLTFSSSDAANKFKVSNQIEISKKFTSDGLEFNAFDMTFYSRENTVTYTIIADSINEISRKYFLLNELGSDSTIGQYKEYLESVSFNCTISE